MSRIARAVSVFSVSALCFVALTGCGIGTEAAAPVPADTVIPRISGVIHGGPNPIIGATIMLYVAGSGTSPTYGSAPSIAIAADPQAVPAGYIPGNTDQNGYFSFHNNAGYSCPAGDFLYLVGSGGNTGNGPSSTSSTATGTANLSSGGVSSITPGTAGAGYNGAPTVTITPASGDTTGSGATATAVMGTGTAAGQVVSYTINSTGSNYTLTPTVTVANPPTANYYTPNNAAVQVAALGPCSSLDPSTTSYTGPFVYMNEVTTVAAAYALGQFSSVSGSAPYQVYINAPANNNASTGSTTAAAGLQHAFLNAYNLANPFSSSVLTSGANSTTVTPNYSSSAPTATSGIVPQALINSIANSVVACVNSSGSGSPACSGEFTDVGGSPTNTFSELVNLAVNPTCSGTSGTCQSFLGLASGFISAYSPNLTSTSGVNDLSIGIDYVGCTNTTGLCSSGLSTTITDMVYPQSGALDKNDVFYVGSTFAAVQAGSPQGLAPVGIFSFSSNGTLIGTGSNESSSVQFAYGLSMDSFGNGWFGNGSKSSASALIGFTTSSGTPSTLSLNKVSGSYNGGTKHTGIMNVYDVAVDAGNNVWTLGPLSGSGVSSLVSCASNSSSTGVITTTGGSNCIEQSTFALTSAELPYTQNNGNAFSSGVVLAIDPYQNVWTITAGSGNTGSSSNMTSIGILANTGSIGTPTYPAVTSALLTGTSTTTPTLGLAFVANSPTASYAPYISGTAGFQSIGYTLTGGAHPDQIATITPGSNFGTSALPVGYASESDGLGTLWTANNSGSAIEQTGNPSAGSSASFYPIKPCFVSANACSTVFRNSGAPISIAIDSAGSIWTIAPLGPNVIQIIGSAAPTWPLLSLGKTGEPQ